MDLRAEIVRAGRRLYDRNMLAAADGNISVRDDDGTILITPSGVSKAFMDPNSMARLNLMGSILDGVPSSERLMHLSIYRCVPEAKAVVHAHPPTAIAWSIARPDLEELPCASMSEVILAAGRIPIVPYARPGTKRMGEALERFLPECRIMILAHHGAIAWGESLEEAVWGMERLEHAALILSGAARLGALSELDSDELAALRALRQEIGPRIR